VTTLVIVLFLDAMFGGSIRAEVTYLTPTACQAMKTTVRKLTVPHVVERDCAPAPADAQKIPDAPKSRLLVPDRPEPTGPAEPPLTPDTTAPEVRRES
jgi:hypothetical protein